MSRPSEDQTAFRFKAPREPILRLFDDEEVVVDNFAGGGGASTGIEIALGYSPHIAINHDPEALAMHEVNHPKTRHLCESVWDVDPALVCGGRQVGLAWFSPDCTFHSKARGGRPFRDRDRARRRRGLAWVVVRWAESPAKPRVIALENVEEFEDWGPLDKGGRPDPLQRGFTFRRWVARLRNLGYIVEWKQLRACDYGAPTSRKRLFVIARCDGQPIVWPEPTHGPGRAQPYRTAAECIDWSIPCPSIFDRARPLAENTMRRIARGVQRYVLQAAKPFIVPMTHGNRPTGIDEPIQTVTTQGNRFNLVAPIIAPLTHQKVAKGEHGERGQRADEPLPTITSAHRGEQAVIAPLLAPVKTWGGGGNDAMPADRPMRTITSSKRGEHAIVAPLLVEYHAERSDGEQRSKSVDAPLPTQDTSNRFGVVAPLLARLGQTGGNGAYVNDLRDPLTTITTKAEHLLVAPTLIVTGNGERDGQSPRANDVRDPMRTITATGSQGAVVAAFLAKHNAGHEATGQRAERPLDTITARDTKALVSAHLLNLKGSIDHRQVSGAELETPMPTVCAEGTHLAEVCAFLVKYFGTDQDPRLESPMHTVTTKDRFALVTVMIDGQEYAIVDIGMRMLAPRELFRAQSFPDTYQIDIGPHGEALTKTAQVRMCGNSAPPLMVAAIIRANCPRRAAAAAR